MELLPPSELGDERCVLFDFIRGPLQSVQRAELWGVILALQCSSAVHLGVDNLNVVRHVSRILEGRVPCRPVELTFDVDLLTIIERMVHQRGVQSVKVSKLKGHADDGMVAVGRVRVEDRIGNALADRAADFGRRRVSDLVIDVRGRSLSACSSWYPVVLELHRFFIAIARAAVMMAVLGLLCIQLFGLVEVWPRNGRFVSLLGSLLGSQVLLVFGGMALLVGLALRFVMMMLVLAVLCWAPG